MQKKYGFKCSYIGKECPYIEHYVTEHCKELIKQELDKQKKREEVKKYGKRSK
ncbi:MAG: hypothetical protein ACTSPB_02040 [Candidatus Thorarchaeota archaeon]